MDVKESALHSIGDTPLVKLNRMAKGLDANVFVKLEFYNPTGSMKDRMALAMIEGAERRGQLRPGIQSSNTPEAAPEARSPSFARSRVID